MTKPFRLNATALRLIAMGCMLLDHAWATVIPGNNWMNILGRIAFPIFAFQAAEGYRHTSDFRRYCLRLLLFGLVSEIPFNLMLTGSPFFPFHQNVMFTLLLGLLAIRQLDRIRTRPDGCCLPLCWGKLALIGLGGLLLLPDYGLPGLMTVVCFYLVQNFPWEKTMQLAAMIAIHCFVYEGQTIPLFGGLHFPVQGFAVLALIPIWLYDGTRGKGGKWFQYAAYLFYPAHMLILYLISLI